jgi:hypothetical protein
MRFLLLVASLLAFLVNARPAEACCAIAGGGAGGYGGYSLHVTDPAQADDATPPSAPEVDVDISRYDQGCGSNGLDLELTMQATDDRAPAERIGFLVTVASGEFSIEIEDGAIVPNGLVAFYFAEDELPFEGELEVRAIDLNGNIGPPTFVEVWSSGPSSRKRFASVRGAGPLLTYGLIGLALVIARRRPRCPASSPGGGHTP